MKALAHLVWGEGVPDCKRCAHDPALRAEFGCDDEPAPKPLYAVSCSACGGGRAPSCARCHGEGETPIFRCARRGTRDNPEVEMIFRLFQNYDDHGVLPADGGLAQQTSQVFHAFEILRAEKAMIDNERVRKQEREKIRAQKLADRPARGSAMSG